MGEIWIIPLTQVSDSGPLPADRPAEEITEAMIVAGVEAFSFRDRPSEIVEAVYRAMRRVALGPRDGFPPSSAEGSL